MSVRFRIFAAFGALSLCLVLIAAFMVTSAVGRMNEAGTVADRVETAPVISALVHELQKERGMSAVYISSRGARFGAELRGQRQDTDGAQAAFEAISRQLDKDSAITSQLSRSRGQLAELVRTRQNVSNQTIVVSQMAGYYTPLISGLLDIAGGATEGISDGEIVRQGAVYAAVLQAKERAGIERAMGAAGFGAGAFNSSVFQRFVSLASAQDVFLSTAKSEATSEQITFMDQTLTGPLVDNVLRMRRVAGDSVFGGVLEGVTGAQWFAASTARIDLFKVVEDRVAADLSHAADVAVGSARAAMIAWLVFAAVIVVLAGGIALWVNRGIAAPLASLVVKINKVAEGDLDIEIEEAQRSDELGQMGQALEVFKKNAAERVALEAKQHEEGRANEERRIRVEALIEEFRTASGSALGNLTSEAGELTSTGSSLESAASSAQDGANAADRSSGEASASVQTVAAAVEEMSASINEIAERVFESQKSATAASDNADTTMERIAKLEAAAQAIGSVVTFIAEIAEQTNLLALNATIEAARAGEAGKGFAVVAAEVKELANQTGKATSDISEQVQAIQEQAQDAVAGIETITKSFADLRESSGAIAAAIEEQTAATQSISEGVQGAALGSAEASDSVRALADAVSQTSSGAETVGLSATRLADVANNLDQVVGKFLEDVAAA